MGHESRRIQHKALDLLNNKLQQLETNKIKTEDVSRFSYFHFVMIIN